MEKVEFNEMPASYADKRQPVASGGIYYG